MTINKRSLGLLELFAATALLLSCSDDDTLFNPPEDTAPPIPVTWDVDDVGAQVDVILGAWGTDANGVYAVGTDDRRGDIPPQRGRLDPGGERYRPGPRGRLGLGGPRAVRLRD
jgi:hypothetical protein